MSVYFFFEIFSAVQRLILLAFKLFHKQFYEITGGSDGSTPDFSKHQEVFRGSIPEPAVPMEIF